MASAKELKRKIKSISNTKKITRTMEMVATARSKRAQDRVKATSPYSLKLSELLGSIAQAGTIAHPLLAPREVVKHSLLLVVSGNRGLCGGYNSSVLGMAERWLAEARAAARDTELHLIGKKGINRFRFLRIAAAKTYTHIEDKPSFKDAEALAREFMGRFLAGELDRVVVISTRYLSASTQKPAAWQLLPIEAGAEGEEAGRKGTDFIFEPDRETILDALLPLSITQALFRAFLEAAVSEQIARRVAMKLASDNAEEMIRSYTRKYNRQRQAGITQQITEVVTGAQALE